MIARRRMLTTSTAALVMSALSSSFVLAADPILTLKGQDIKIGQGSIQSSLGDLDALPQTEFSTTTPWNKGRVTFSGVSLKDYLAAFGLMPKSIRLIALNDYSVKADVAELLAADALLATRQNGQPMPISDKGPVFLIFPFDSRTELQHQTYYSRAVWQLSEIDILP